MHSLDDELNHEGDELDHEGDERLTESDDDDEMNDGKNGPFDETFEEDKKNRGATIGDLNKRKRVSDLKNANAQRVQLPKYTGSLKRRFNGSKDKHGGRRGEKTKRRGGKRTRKIKKCKKKTSKQSCRRSKK